MDSIRKAPTRGEIRTPSINLRKPPGYLKTINPEAQRVNPFRPQGYWVSGWGSSGIQEILKKPQQPQQPPAQTPTTSTIKFIESYRSPTHNHRLERGRLDYGRGSLPLLPQLYSSSTQSRVSLGLREVGN